jgi:hypothetical protein
MTLHPHPSKRQRLSYNNMTKCVLLMLILDLSLVAGLVPTGKIGSNAKRSFSLTAPSAALHGTASDNNNQQNKNPQRRRTAAPKRSYVRLLPRTARGNRRMFELQTAVTTMERTTNNQKQTMELHAQIHFGEEDYFAHYNSPEFMSRFNSVYYELLVDEHLMKQSTTGSRVLPPGADGQSVLMASPSDRQTAKQYGLTCQVDVLDYSAPNWIHADMTRQEFMSLAASNDNNVETTNQQPLWALASTAPTWPGAEAVSAVFRPATPSTPLNTPVAQRLFSNLFLAGTSLTTALRLLFWILVPAPELSVMVLDWSSLSPRPTGGVSSVALPVLESLLTGNIQEARQLVFGQVLVSGQRSSGDEKNDLVVAQRNDHALQVVMDSFDDTTRSRSTALLYGAMHCPDLYSKLLAQGFVPIKTSWRTAWSVRVPSFGTSTDTTKGEGKFLEAFAGANVSPNALGVGLVIVPLYLAIGGLDWIGTVQEVTSSLRAGNLPEAIFAEVLYLVRHVALYLGLAKFVVDWDTGGINLFER